MSGLRDIPMKCAAVAPRQGGGYTSRRIQVTTMQKRKNSVSDRPSGRLFGYPILVLLLGVFASAVQAVEVMTAAGDLHSLYLADDGTVWLRAIMA